MKGGDRGGRRKRFGSVEARNTYKSQKKKKKEDRKG